MTTDANETRTAGYDDLLDAIEDGEPYFLECPDGHGSLPPRRVCPECGVRDLTETALPESGRIDAHTVVHVSTPSFTEDAPYVTAVASFGPVRLTGQVRGVEPEAVENGTPVTVAVGATATTGRRLLVFEPR